MDNITFRTASGQDVETLFQVKIAAFADEFEQFRYADADEIFKNIVNDCNINSAKEDMFSLEWHKRICDFGDWTQLILNDSKIIGSICALPGKHSGHEYPDVDMSDDDINILICIYILPEYKNKGIGGMAMKYMEELHPAQKWILDTPDVSIKNKHFYQKCGYSFGLNTGPNNLLRIFTKGI